MPQAKVYLKPVVFALFLSVMGANVFAVSNNECASLFNEDTSVPDTNVKSMLPTGSTIARLSLLRGTFFHLSSGEQVKVVETPNPTDTSVKVLRFQTTQEIELIKIEDLTARYAGPIRLKNLEKVSVEGQTILPMLTLLYSKDLKETFFFTGKGYPNIYSPIVEVYSHKLKTMILISSDRLLIATPERKAFMAKLDTFNFVDYYNRYSNTASNLKGIHRFEIDTQTGALMASVTEPESAPGVDLRRMWRKSIESFERPVEIPSSVGDGFLVCVEAKNFYGLFTYKFAFFKTPEEAIEFANRWRDEDRSRNKPN